MCQHRRENGFRLQSIYHGYRNLVWKTYRENEPKRLAWARFPWHMAMNLAVIGFLIIQRKGKAIVGARRDALLGLPKTEHNRQGIRMTRGTSVSKAWQQLDNLIIGKQIVSEKL